MVKGLPFEEYCKRPGINGSILKAVDEYSLKTVRAIMDGKIDDDTAAMRLGTSFHALLLENRQDFVIHPETYTNEKGEEKPWNWNAKVCKAWRDEQFSQTVLSPGDAQHVVRMVETVRNDAELCHHLHGEAEVSIFAEKDGLPVKSRIDLLTDSLVIDFKKTRSANPEAFLRQAYDKRYHLAAAWNLDVLRWAGIERKEFWLVGIEDHEPFDMTILRFKDEPASLLRVGRARARAAFQKLANAMESNRWPSYGSHSAEMFLKPWMLPEVEQTA